MELEQKADWKTRARGDNDSEYQIYLACADDGKGNEFMTGNPPMIKTSLPHPYDICTQKLYGQMGKSLSLTCRCHELPQPAKHSMPSPLV
ncbi:hypothetical protein SOV88_02450 [Pectobacterium brasiliense]|nr:hypothetical protein [Pectobacterium brasiliense]MDY4323140.1 hypothetical protein [Pectobacterium brasiliense]MDY4348562.1 hypothetical protein [Pectobacterium brasiliense]